MVSCCYMEGSGFDPFYCATLAFCLVGLSRTTNKIKLSLCFFFFN